MTGTPRVSDGSSAIPDPLAAYPDPLAALRDQFVITDPQLIYLDGNSLGRLPKATADLSRRLVEQAWGDRLVRSWNEGWLELAGRIGGKIAGVLGAEPDEVIVADCTSVCLYKLVVAALRARPGRTRIVTDDLNFPSDHYVLQSAIRGAGEGYRLDVLRSPDGITLPLEQVEQSLGPDVALVTFSHTAFKSAFVHDTAAVNAAAHRAGSLTLWDLSHSVGAVPVALRESGADLAVGCTYKYLNGGPGAPAFLYVRRELQDQLANPIGGWMGQRDAFSFGLEYQPVAGIGRFLTGTPPILSTALIEPGVDLVLEAGIDRIREKSVRQTEWLIRAWEGRLQPLGYSLRSPREAARRGSHVTLGHPEGHRITQALIERHGVIPDFRAPDCIRLGVAPLYTSDQELARAVEALEAVVTGRQFEAYPSTRPGAT